MCSLQEICEVWNVGDNSCGWTTVSEPMTNTSVNRLRATTRHCTIFWLYRGQGSTPALLFTALTHTIKCSAKSELHPQHQERSNMKLYAKINMLTSKDRLQLQLLYNTITTTVHRMKSSLQNWYSDIFRGILTFWVKRVFTSWGHWSKAKCTNSWATEPKTEVVSTNQMQGNKLINKQTNK